MYAYLCFSFLPCKLRPHPPPHEHTQYHHAYSTTQSNNPDCIRMYVNTTCIYCTDYEWSTAYTAVMIPVHQSILNLHMMWCRVLVTACTLSLISKSSSPLPFSAPSAAFSSCCSRQPTSPSRGWQRPKSTGPALLSRWPRGWGERWWERGPGWFARTLPGLWVRRTLYGSIPSTHDKQTWSYVLV